MPREDRRTHWLSKKPAAGREGQGHLCRGGERSIEMRYLSRRSLGLVVAAAVVTVAASLAFATGGRAASPNICLRPSAVDTSTGRLMPASCVTELVAPHFVTAGADAISVTKFTNESSGGATATHTAVSATFPTATGV